MLTFRDVPVVPVRRVQREDVGTASGFIGGPVWPDWESQTVARFCRRGEPADIAPTAMPTEETVDDPGAFWIGPLHLHFGHAIQDFLPRVPESLVARPDATLVFGAVAGNRVATLADAPGWFRQILDWFEVPAERVRFVSRPTLFRTLNVVPQPEQLGVPPRADYLDRLDALLARKPPPPAPVEHLYVSRAGQASRLPGESYLETVLAACGARILRPEAHPIAAQLDAYRSARHIVFAEGSAIHGLQLLGRGIGDVDVLCRRARTRIGDWLVEPRARSLAYHDVVVSQLRPVKASGAVVRMRMLPMVDVNAIKDLLERRGLPIRRYWDDAAWSAAAEEDVREWLAFIAGRNMLARDEQRERVRRDLEKSPFPHLADLVSGASAAVARGTGRRGRRVLDEIGGRRSGVPPRRRAAARKARRTKGAGANGHDPAPAPSTVPLSRRPPPVVVGATGGSGTRAFQGVLAALDVYMGARLNNAGDALDIEPFFNRWVNKLTEAHNRIDYEWDALDPDTRTRAVAALKLRLNQYLAPCPRETRWGWKSPRSIWTLPVIEHTVPGFRFLHVVRDGRDMAFSSNINQFRKHSGALFGAPGRAAGDADGPALARLWSAVNGQAADWAERHLGERYLRVRLEDLCADPRGTVEAIARWLALDPPQDALARAAGTVKSPSSLGRWREAPAPETAAIAAAAAGSLERFGYAAA